MLIIDTHCHAGKNWFEPIETLEFQMDRCGVSGAVLIQHGGTYDNDYLFAAAANRPGRFKVVVLVDPASADPLGDLTRFAEAGASGVRLSPHQDYRTPHRHDIWKKAGELGLVVSSLGKPAEFAADDFKRLSDTCGDTRIVIEHLASVGIADPPYREFEAALESARCGNIAIKVPGLAEICPRPPRLAPEFRFDNVPPLFEMTRDAFGVQRMMWGSDFPPSAGREGYENTLEGVRDHPAFIGVGDAEWVMGKTAAQWWGFEGDQG
jgi:L-fuconolactonase